MLNQSSLFFFSQLCCITLFNQASSDGTLGPFSVLIPWKYCGFSYRPPPWEYCGKVSHISFDFLVHISFVYTIL